MKALIYINPEKDFDSEFKNRIIKCLEKENISFELISNSDLEKNYNADLLIVYGGDGTILKIKGFACKNNIPILGINAGKVGFLNEFEKSETELAVKLFIDNELIKDVRMMLCAEYNDKKYSALNDVVIHRLCNETTENDGIINLNVYLDNVVTDIIGGDGVIVGTPTGSTAYSLSAGGPILAPNVNAFALTPISAQFLHHRPIVFSANSECKIEKLKGNSGLYIDGKFISKIEDNSSVFINKEVNNLTFLRRKDSNFYKRLVKKLFDGRC